jgi:DNA-binding NarL/FixJ family response regulator
MLTASEEEGPIRQLLAAGVLGYITKSTPRDGILAALRQVMAGGIYTPPGMLEAEEERENLPAHSAACLAITRRHPSLSQRHLEVLRHLVKGLSNRQIGEALDVTEGTVKLHVTAILRILKVANRTEAVLVAQKMGLDADD